MRVYVTDRKGRVVFDSQGRRWAQDFSRWRDVALTLEGQYGARTTNDVERRSAHGGHVCRRPDLESRTRSSARSASDARSSRSVSTSRLRAVASSGRASCPAPPSCCSRCCCPSGSSGPSVSSPAMFVTCAANPGAHRPRFGRGALQAMAAAYQEMRDALAGRQYVTEYVQTLTHEIKSPLAAIRGAAELLQEPMPEPDRARFVVNILRESARMEELVDRLLELAALERQRRSRRPGCRSACARRAEAAMHATRAACAAPARQAPAGGRTRGLAAWRSAAAHAARSRTCSRTRSISRRLREASSIAGRAGRQPGTRHRARRRSRDSRLRGGRVFDRFYSLARPHNGKKGTGLGLAFVKEIAELHHGSATLDNGSGGGAIATLRLPIAAD